jgi:hypothetical protein
LKEIPISSDPNHDYYNSLPSTHIVMSDDLFHPVWQPRTAEFDRINLLLPLSTVFKLVLIAVSTGWRVALGSPLEARA